MPLFVFGMSIAEPSSGRGVVDGPGFNSWDLAAIKNTKIAERVRTQFRAEFFNAFNHTSFRDVQTAVNLRPRQLDLRSAHHSIGYETTVLTPRFAGVKNWL
jgi:hypothetical protein